MGLDIVRERLGFWSSRGFRRQDERDLSMEAETVNGL